MNSRTAWIFCTLAGLSLLPATPARAQDSTRFKTQLSTTFQYNMRDHTDLGTKGDDTRDSASAQARARMSYDFGDDVTGFLDLRAVGATGDSGIEDENGQVSPSDSFLEARQYWLRIGRFMGSDHTALQAGRQRIREESGLWWNKDIESVRLLYDSTLLRGFFGFAEALSSNRTAQDSFDAEDRDRFRLLGEGSYQWRSGQFLEARFHYQSDHSETGQPGDIIPEEKRDDEDLHAAWAGLRAAGTIAAPAALLDRFKYKIDLMGVAGSEDSVASVSGPASGTRAIAAVDHRAVRGWALDTRFHFTLNAPLHPVLTLGYAYGSGDSGGGTDHAFRQTGLQSNAGLLGASSRPVYGYGEVLRPELSNLHILTAGLGFPLADYADLDFFYHYYRLAEEAAELRRASVNAALSGTSLSLGQEGDVVFNLDLGKMIKSERQIKFRATAGVFDAGAAYGPAEDETAVRVFSEIAFGL
jgi:hypothetical protein